MKIVPKVLVVEDTQTHQMIAEYALKKLNVEATFVEDGLTAIDTITQYKPDLMLLDLWLPGVNGETVLARTQALYGDKGINTIIVTSQTVILRELQRQFPFVRDLIIKPYVPQQLIDAVSSLLFAQTENTNSQSSLSTKHPA